MQHILFVSNFFIRFYSDAWRRNRHAKPLQTLLASNEEVTFERVIFLSEDDQASDIVCSFRCKPLNGTFAWTKPVA